MKKIVLYCLIAPSLSIAISGVGYSSTNIKLPDLGISDSAPKQNNSSSTENSNKKNKKKCVIYLFVANNYLSLHMK